MAGFSDYGILPRLGQKIRRKAHILYWEKFTVQVAAHTENIEVSLSAKQFLIISIMFSVESLTIFRSRGERGNSWGLDDEL